LQKARQRIIRAYLTNLYLNAWILSKCKDLIEKQVKKID
jgi:hypothetical protein